MDKVEIMGIESYLIESSEKLRKNLFIKEMDLSKRTRNALLRDGYRKLSDFEGLKLRELSDQRLIGKTAIEELSKVLHKYECTIDGKEKVIHTHLGKEIEILSLPLKEVLPSEVFDSIFTWRVPSAEVISGWSVGYFFRWMDFYNIPGVVPEKWQYYGGSYFQKLGFELKPVKFKDCDEVYLFPVFVSKAEKSAEGESVLLKAFKKYGLAETIKEIDEKFFEKNSRSMEIIASSVEEYLNWIVEEKTKNASVEQLSEIEKQVEQESESYKQLVEQKREEKTKREFISSMKQKIGETKKFHHAEKRVKEEGHRHNPFADKDLNI